VQACFYATSFCSIRDEFLLDPEITFLNHG